jgi:hypothetical protein
MLDQEPLLHNIMQLIYDSAVFQAETSALHKCKALQPSINVEKKRNKENLETHDNEVLWI